MRNEKPEKVPMAGFISSDGYFQDIRTLKSSELEYAHKSLEELKKMIRENLACERYEKCAEIRDEIKKRRIRKN